MLKASVQQQQQADAMVAMQVDVELQIAERGTAAQAYALHFSWQQVSLDVAEPAMHRSSSVAMRLS